MVGELERLMRLINDLLDMEKMQAGKFEMFPVRTKLADLVEASITAVRHIADSRTIRLVNETADGECLTDGARTIRVLVNLLSNALKSSSRGSQIVAGSSVLDDGKIVIAVKDWGRGVPANQRDVIFERFTQVYSSDSRDKGGSGLGLHICKTIIQQQGGSIWVEPNPEGGSIFLFSLEVYKFTVRPWDRAALVILVFMMLLFNAIVQVVQKTDRVRCYVVRVLNFTELEPLD